MNGESTKGEYVAMIKKMDAVTETEKLVAVNNVVDQEPMRENVVLPVEPPRQQRKVNLIIHEWLTDMWLLTTGEETDFDHFFSSTHHGRPLAFVCDGQMRLLGSRSVTLDALREVGIEMS